MPEDSENTPNKQGMSFAHLRNNTEPQWWRDPCLRMNVFHCIGLYFSVFYMGYDGSLLNGLQNLPQWTKYFNNPSSNYLGLMSSCFFLPAIVVPYLTAALNSKFGRKPCLALASGFLIVGTFINAFAINGGMFMGGRVLLGIGGGFGKITAAALLQEIAHPRLRPILTSSYYNNYYVGSIVSAWFCYGTLGWGDTNWAWRAPCLFQVVAPAVLAVFLFIIPESPRWLIHHGYKERALNILAKSHANGDLEDELVRHEYNEICIAMELEEENANVRYIDFFKTPGNRRRLLVQITMATGGNWVGNGVITYYLTPVLKLVGITNARQISSINGGLAIFNYEMAFVGSTNVERFGRRKLWLTSTAGMLVAYIVMTGLSGSYASTGNHSVGIATVPMIFIFFGFYDIGWTPLPYSYGGEILPYHMRVKGLSIQHSVQSIAQAFNQWVNPVALASIGWKYYIVYIATLTVYLTLIALFFPETRHLTVEEVSVVFDTGRLGNAKAATAEFGRREGKLLGPKQGDSYEQQQHIETIEP